MAFVDILPVMAPVVLSGLIFVIVAWLFKRSS